MSWTFQQSTGRIVDANGTLLTIGYAGHGAGLDNPADQSIPFVGPLPIGGYTMDTPINSPRLGGFAIPLIPDASNQEFGRNGFYWHGDNAEHDESASEGCLVSSLESRQTAWESGDHRLQVIT